MKNIQNIIDNIRSLKQFVNRLDERFHQFMVQQANNNNKSNNNHHQSISQQPISQQPIIPAQSLQSQLPPNQNIIFGHPSGNIIDQQKSDEYHKLKQLRSIVKTLIQR